MEGGGSRRGPGEAPQLLVFRGGPAIDSGVTKSGVPGWRKTLSYRNYQNEADAHPYGFSPRMFCQPGAEIMDQMNAESYDPERGASNLEESTLR